jgi:c-di-AMP phosphodiesterase-like protein
MIYKKAKILGLILFVVTYVIFWFFVSQFTESIGIIGSVSAVMTFILAPKIQKSSNSQSEEVEKITWMLGEDNFKKLYRILFKS